MKKTGPHKSYLPLIIIPCLGILIYSNTFGCSFHLDDFYTIVENSFIKDIHNPLSIWKCYPCRFVTYLSTALNYHFNGLDIFGYHLFNLAIHLTSAVLVWWLTLLTFSTPAMKEDKITKHANLIALFAGLLFVSHPIQTEAVTYICQRAASMAALFYLASLCFYIKSRLLPNTKNIYYTCSLIAAVLAIFTKENAVTLPLMILLYEFSFFESLDNLNWSSYRTLVAARKDLFPFLLTLFIIPLTMLFARTQQFPSFHRFTMDNGPISHLDYLLTQIRVMVTYIRLDFLPFNQNIDYDYPLSKSIVEFPTLISFLFLAGILYSAKHYFSKYRLLAFPIFWFFVTLLPESSFIPRPFVIFEHRLYLPLVGYSIFLVCGLYYLLGKNSIKMMVVILMIIVFFNSILTFQRNKIWANEITLWTDTVDKSPHEARPNYSIGLYYYKLGNFTQSTLNYNKALEINPDYIAAYVNRGINYDQEGNFVSALSDFNKAIEINPNVPEAYYSRGETYTKQKDLPQALFNFNKAIEINPDYVEAYINRGSIYTMQGNFTEALSNYNKSIEINPNYAEAYYNRGCVYHKQGDLTQALNNYNEAIKINPNYALAYNNRAVAYYQLKEYVRAWDDVNKAKQLGSGVNPEFIKELAAHL